MHMLDMQRGRVCITAIAVRVLRDHFFERYRDRDWSRFLKLNDTDTESSLAF